MKYAIIEITANQYLVHPGDDIVVNAHLGTPGETLTGFEVLAEHDGQSLKIGTPVLKSSLKATVVKHLRGPKVISQTYTAKSRHRKKIGHRQDQTLIHFELTSTLKSAVPKPNAPVTKPKQPVAAKKTTPSSKPKK